MLVAMLGRPTRRRLLALAFLAPAARSETPRPVVVLRTSHGAVRIELYPEVAPRTVSNFVSYVESGFYDDTVFHRVIENFVVQGGGFTPELVPKPAGKPIRIETKDGMPNARGTVAMARQWGRNTATSQFFINLKDNATLNRGSQRFGYTVFGRVLEGMEVVERISRVQTSRRGPMEDVPILPVFLEAARVEGQAPEER